jgi:uncharacterized membrane-anchored protein
MDWEISLMTDETALMLVDALNGLSTVLSIFSSPAHVQMIVQAGLMAWVLGLGIGLGLRYLSKMG